MPASLTDPSASLAVQLLMPAFSTTAPVLPLTLAYGCNQHWCIARMIVELADVITLASSWLVDQLY